MKSRNLIHILGTSVCALVASTALAQPGPARPPAPGAPPAAVAPAAAAPAPPAAVAPAPLGPGAVVPPPPGAALAPADIPVFTDRALPDRAPPTIEGVEPESGGLTANEVARRALAASPSVREQRARLEAAGERITQTMIQFFPKITLAASYTRVSRAVTAFPGGFAIANNTGLLGVGPCTNGEIGPTANCVLDSSGNQNVRAQPFIIPTVLDNYSVSGRVSIPLSDYVLRLSDAAAASNASRDAARYSVDAARLKVDSDARALYFNWLRARGQVSISQKSVEQTRARLSDAQASFEVGAISKAELLRIQALVANTEIVLTRSESMLALTTGQLAIVMEDWHPNYHVGEGIPLPATIANETEPLDKLVAEAQQRRLEIRALDESVRALRRGSDATRAGAYPRVDAVGDVTDANPNQRYFPLQKVWHTTWSAGVQASWTIDDIFQQSAAARELEQNAIEMENKRREAKAGVAQEVLIAYLDLARARAELQKWQTSLDSAQEAYRVTTDLFRAGRATGTDLIAAETGLLETKIGEMNARIDLAIASLTLRHAAGRDISAQATAKN